MKIFGIVMLVIAIVLVIALIVLYFLGKKAQKKREEQEEQIAAAAQTVSMLIIDKKRLRLTESGLPQQVIDQTPKMMRRSKLPIVKAKVGPRVMTLIADEKIFDEIPVKKEVKATVSGLYITGVFGVPWKSHRLRKRAFVPDYRPSMKKQVPSSRKKRKNNHKDQRKCVGLYIWKSFLLFGMAVSRIWQFARCS